MVLWALGSLDPTAIAADDANIRWFTAGCFALVLCAATQDIAVDGLAVSLLPPSRRAWASTVQTAGLQCGFFASVTLFLALNSADFCNDYVRSWLGIAPSADGLLSLPLYWRSVGAMYVLASLALVVFFVEPTTPALSTTERDVGAAYRRLVDVARLAPVRRLAAILLSAKVGFVLFDSVTMLKLLEKVMFLRVRVCVCVCCVAHNVVRRDFDNKTLRCLLFWIFLSNWALRFSSVDLHTTTRRSHPIASDLQFEQSQERWAL